MFSKKKHVSRFVYRDLPPPYKHTLFPQSLVRLCTLEWLQVFMRSLWPNREVSHRPSTSDYDFCIHSWRDLGQGSTYIFRGPTAVCRVGHAPL